MTYSQAVNSACYRSGDVTEGTCIHMWLREVGDNLNATFEAILGPDDGSGKCMLCWKNTANEDGQLVLTYYCDDAGCLGAGRSGTGSECVLQYSYDGVEFAEVTPDEPPPNVRCYFRCECCVGSAKKNKKKAKKPVKKKAAASRKKAKGKAKRR